MTIKEVENQTGLARSNVRFMKRKSLLSRPGMRVMDTENIQRRT